jgi:hypothetical protein
MPALLRLMQTRAGREPVHSPGRPVRPYARVDLRSEPSAPGPTGPIPIRRRTDAAA